jgi:hypothetical protein
LTIYETALSSIPGHRGRLSISDGIIAIPLFMRLALMRASSSYSKVLCLAAVEAIKHVLEIEAEDEEVIQQYVLIDLIYIPQWLFLVSRRSLFYASIGVGVDWLLEGTAEGGWLYSLDYSPPHHRHANENAMELEHAKLHHPELQFLQGKELKLRQSCMFH